IGSGKTAIAGHLRDKYGFQYLRYSLVLADWKKTDPDAKTELQEVGWDVMSGGSQRELNRRLIALIDRRRDCTIDGLRDPVDYESLSKAFLPHFFLIYVDTPSEIRFQRLRNRYQTYEAFLKAD